MDRYRRWELIVHCFLDDSGKESQPSNPYVVMAGYFADSDVWQHLCTEWFGLLLKHKISAIHMKDLIPIEGEYKTHGWDISKRDAVIAEFIDVINKSPVLGVGIALEMAAWRKLTTNINRSIGTAQEFCLQRILLRIIDHLDAAQLDGKVVLIFDWTLNFPLIEFICLIGL
jgi:hypothetical protein